MPNYIYEFILRPFLAPKTKINLTNFNNLLINFATLTHGPMIEFRAISPNRSMSFPVFKIAYIATEERSNFLASRLHHFFSFFRHLKSSVVQWTFKNARKIPEFSEYHRACYCNSCKNGRSKRRKCKNIPECAEGCVKSAH